jgi:hypothetical protein
MSDDDDDGSDDDIDDHDIEIDSTKESMCVHHHAYH